MLRRLGGAAIPGVTRRLASRCAASGRTAVGQERLPSVVNYRATTAQERTVMGDVVARSLTIQRSSTRMSSVDTSLKGDVEERSGSESGADGDAGDQNEDSETPTWEGLTEEEAQTAIEGPDPPKRKPRIKYGVVSSDRMDKTVMVKVPYVYIMPLYGKRITRHSKLMSHDEENTCRVGDLVGVVHTPKKYSKRKSHKVVVIKRRANYL